MQFQWVTLNNRAKKYGADKENIGDFADEMETFNKTIDSLYNGDPGRPVVGGKVVRREQIAEGQPAGDNQTPIGIYVPLEGSPMEGPEAYAGME